MPPAELEALLLTHPAVADAAVIGLPDDEAGEIPVGFVVLDPGPRLTEEDVKAFVGRTGGALQAAAPGASSSTRSRSPPSGKILRRVLRDRAGR